MQKTLKQLLNKDQPLVLPGVFNAITALLAQEAGFQAVYLSGAGVSNSLLAKPDIGLVTLPELAGQVRHIADAVRIPILVDADTGFGDFAKIKEVVRKLEDAGASAIQIEDQVSAKKCGHLKGKHLVSSEVMVQRIQAAIQARRNKDLMIVARTDARSVEGMDAAIRRAQGYVEAGADMIFPEALESRDEFRAFAKAIHAPLMANMTEFGKTPYISVSEFKRLGYTLVIFPMTAFRVMMKSARDAFLLLRKKGSQKNLLSKMQTRRELYDLLGYPERVDNSKSKPV